MLLEYQEVFRESGQLGFSSVDLGDERRDRQRCVVGGVATWSRAVHTERPHAVLAERLESVAYGLGDGAPFAVSSRDHGFSVRINDQTAGLGIIRSAIPLPFADKRPQQPDVGVSQLVYP